MRVRVDGRVVKHASVRGRYKSSAGRSGHSFPSIARRIEERKILPNIRSNISIASLNQRARVLYQINPLIKSTPNWIAQTSSSSSNVDPVGSETTPMTSEVQGLTSFKESANVLTVTPAASIDRPLSHSYPTQTPSQLINKPYQIGQYSWNNVWAGTQIVLPQVLNGIDTITNVLLSRFRYWRSSIKLEFKLTTTQFHQGSLLIGWIPCWDSSATAPSLQTLSGCNASVLSASTQDSLTITIPYLCPDSWIDTQQGVVALDDRHSTVFIKPLNALIPTAANMPNAVTLTVFASFTDIQVSGFRSHSSNREAHKKASAGIDASGVVSVATKVIKSSPIGGAITMMADLLSSFRSDLCKPVSQEAAKPVYQSYGNNNSLCSGLEIADQVSQYPNAAVSQAPMMGGMETSHISVNALARKPLLYYTHIFTSVVTELEMSGLTPQNTPIGPDWLAFSAKAFRYWRGSMKFSLHFCVPAFYSFRVQITPTVQTSTINNFGDLPNAIIDVKGETWYDFTVPYERPYEWSPTDGEFAPFLPTVYIRLITPIQGSSAPASPVVYMNIFRSGGEDICFSGLRGARDLLTLNPAKEKSVKVQAHVSINDRFRKPFEGVIPGLTVSMEDKWTMSEVAGSVSDCLKRPSMHMKGGGGYRNTFPCDYPAGAANINYQTIGREPFHYFSNVFWYWRGGRVVGHYQTAGKMVALEQYDTNLMTWGDGAALWFTSNADASLKCNEKVQVPYYHLRPWFPMRGLGHKVSINLTLDPAPLDLVLDSVPDADLLTLCGADDFVGLHPLPFFPQLLSQEARKTKIDARKSSSSAAGSWAKN